MKICAEVWLLLHTTVTMVYNYPILFAIDTLYVYHFYILHFKMFKLNFDIQMNSILF